MLLVLPKEALATMTSDADDMMARLRAELPGALRCGQVVGYFQPEVELSTGRLVAAELLARWEHPDYGTLQPALFLPLAAERGLMGELCRITLRQALAQHRAWAAAGWVVPVSVNIDPDCVADPAFPATVARLLREEQVPGQMLALEVSEETGTTVATSRFFAQLAESGVRVSLDDFGTGFASLESLGGWPVDELKLDRSIVRPMVTSASFRAIVGSTIDLAHQLGVRVVAEGIESEAVSSELRALGCDIGQGFFLGRPMPAAAFTEWMRDPARLVPRLEASGCPPLSPPASEEGPGPAAGAAGRAVRAARRVVQPVGGGALGAAVAMVVVYGLWQVYRWGGREHQALIGDSAFVPLPELLPGRVLGPGFLPACGRSGPAAGRGHGVHRRGGARLVHGARPAVASRARFDLFGTVTCAYPGGDVLLLFGGLMVLGRGVPPSSVMALRIFAGGMLIFIAADLLPRRRLGRHAVVRSDDNRAPSGPPGPGNRLGEDVHVDQLRAAQVSAPWRRSSRTVRTTTSIRSSRSARRSARASSSSCLWARPPRVTLRALWLLGSIT